MWLGVAGAREGELVEEAVAWPRRNVSPASRTMAAAAKTRRTAMPEGRVLTEGVVTEVVVMDGLLSHLRPGSATPADVSRRMHLHAGAVIGRIPYS